MPALFKDPFPVGTTIEVVVKGPFVATPGWIVEAVAGKPDTFITTKIKSEKHMSKAESFDEAVARIQRNFPGAVVTVPEKYRRKIDPDSWVHYARRR